MAATLKEISPAIDKSKIVISIAAGITTNFIENSLTKGARVVRVMPNTPALVGEGASGSCRRRLHLLFENKILFFDFPGTYDTYQNKSPVKYSNKI
jgi:pyrroline-5-carboxylate reductase